MTVYRVVLDIDTSELTDRQPWASRSSEERLEVIRREVARLTQPLPALIIRRTIVSVEERST